MIKINNVGFLRRKSCLKCSPNGAAILWF